jgi:hypothetical protein
LRLGSFEKSVLSCKSKDKVQYTEGKHSIAVEVDMAMGGIECTEGTEWPKGTEAEGDKRAK